MDSSPQNPGWLGRIERIELPLCAYFNRANDLRFINLFFRSVSRLGDGQFWCAVTGVLVVIRGKEAWVPVLHMWLTAGIGVLIYKVLKEGMARERPFVDHEVIHCTARALDRYSFPSGHTLHAVSFAILLASYASFFAWLVIPFAILVALSRVVLGLHYVTDVVVGALIGALIATASLQVAWVYMV